MPNSTTNFGLLQPLVNNPTDQDLWGGYLNTDIGNIDSLLLTCLNWVSSSQTSTITVTIPTAGSSTTGSAKTLYTCNASGGAFSANLPAVATAAGLTVAFKKMDSSANAVTITGHSSDLIDGSNTYALTTQYAYVIIQCDGSEWNILSVGPAATTPTVITGSQAYTSGTGNFTIPSGTLATTTFKFTVTGGGGAGGGIAPSPGGGAGGTAIYCASGLTAGATCAYSIGSGGSGSSGNAGGNGTSTTITVSSTTITGGAGSGGPGAVSALGGLGGSATNGTINLSGGDGNTSCGEGFAGNNGGTGGSSFWGGGGSGGINSAGSFSGRAGAAYGSGGGGCGGASGGAETGAAGAGGVILIEWY